MFAAIDALEFPELHDESIPYMAFIRNCARLLAAAGVRDFNMQARCALQTCFSSAMHPACPSLATRSATRQRWMAEDAATQPPGFTGRPSHYHLPMHACAWQPLVLHTHVLACRRPASRS